MRVTPRHTRIAAFTFAVSAPAPVFAYMGPGIDIGAVGAALGVVASLLLVLISVIWHPLRRLARRSRAARSASLGMIARSPGSERP